VDRKEEKITIPLAEYERLITLEKERAKLPPDVVADEVRILTKEQFRAVVNQARGMDITGTTCTGCIDGVEIIWFIVDLLMRILDGLKLPAQDGLVLAARHAGCNHAHIDRAYAIAKVVGRRRGREGHFLDQLLAIIQMGLDKVRLGAEPRYLAVDDLKEIRTAVVDADGEVRRVLAEASASQTKIPITRNTDSHEIAKEFAKNDVDPPTDAPVAPTPEEPAEEPKDAPDKTERYKLN
jgi:hypothetical protein